jgi:hypothetical protein
MWRNACTGLALCLVANIVLAGQSGATQAVTREWSFDGCHFRMSDPYRGRIDIGSYIATINPKAHHPFEMWIQFDCENNVTISDLSKLAGVGKQNGQWVIAFNGDAKALNTTLYTLHGKGWEGAGITQDQ